MKTQTMPRARTTLDAGRTQRAIHLGAGRSEVWQAYSADGVWSYERVDGVPGTPWEVTHLPTGLAVHMGTLPAAREWTADADTPGELAARARVVLQRGDRGSATPMMRGNHPGARVRVEEPAPVLAERVAIARRALAVLAGHLVAGVPDGICLCGAYLTGGVHADACGECRGASLDARRSCRTVARHTVCAAPDPLLCDHLQCVRPAGPDGADGCLRGRDRCCGCCADSR